ncbi:MAG: hypothetical protein H6705_00430 [Myxococcales bacterium]|nr:hypothetical protein [Myxococcales bacterium]
MRWALCVAVLLAGCYEDNEAEPEGGADAAVGICAPGEARCDVEGRLRTCLDDGLSWLVEPCAAGAMCTDGACVGTVCDPGERRCGEGGVERCAADGSGFAAPVACPAETSCVEGVCLARSCMPGETACGEGARLTCAADGSRGCATNARPARSASTARAGRRSPTASRVRCCAAGRR